MAGARISGLVLLSVLVAGCPGEKGASVPPGPTVRFRVQPVGATTVTLWDAEKGFEERVTATETVLLDAPLERLREPRVTIEARDGSETTSGKLAVSPVTSVVNVGRLHVWPARVRVERDGERLRFSWPAFDVPDAPPELRYSLLFVYRNVRGEEAEGTLIAKDVCEAIQTLSDLSGIFPERDPQARTMSLRVRVYGSSATEGTIWAGPKQEWPVPDDLPLPRGAK